MRGGGLGFGHHRCTHSPHQSSVSTTGHHALLLKRCNGGPEMCARRVCRLYIPSFQRVRVKRWQIFMNGTQFSDEAVQFSLGFCPVHRGEVNGWVMPDRLRLAAQRQMRTLPHHLRRNLSNPAAACGASNIKRNTSASEAASELTHRKPRIAQRNLALANQPSLVKP